METTEDKRLLKSESNTLSRFIKDWTYNLENLSLNITFKDGLVYNYFDIPEKVFRSFVNAKDPDHFFKRYIRHEYRRLFKRFNLEIMQGS
jgi:hypothetical protein